MIEMSETSTTFIYLIICSHTNKHHANHGQNNNSVQRHLFHAWIIVPY